MKSADFITETLPYKVKDIKLAESGRKAIEIAELRGITLVGFVRGNRMNVYTNPQRIRCPE